MHTRWLLALPVTLAAVVALAVALLPRTAEAPPAAEAEVLGLILEQAEARFRKAVLDHVRDDPWLSEHPPKISRLASGFGSARIDQEHPLVQAMAQSAEEEFRHAPTIAAAPYGCDMSGWVRLAGVPTVVYGPGEIELAHAPNESVSLEKTYKVARTLVRATERLLECDPQSLKMRPLEETAPE